jgi:hypothetical protein
MNILVKINNIKEIRLNVLLIRDILLIKTMLTDILREEVGNQVHNLLRAMMSINQNIF